MTKANPSLSADRAHSRTRLSNRGASVRNFAEQEDLVRSDFLREHGIVSVANVPILISDAAWGGAKVRIAYGESCFDSVTNSTLACRVI
jgi:hypothetical protein